jgi:hypothetical protein
MIALPTSHKFNHYGWREGHYRIAPGCPFPPACDAEKMFLYLFIFETKVKVGVSRDVGTRYVAMRKQGGILRQTYTILLSRKEAFARELVVKNHCGVRVARHASEWFGADHAAVAVLLMRNPELAFVMNEVRGFVREFESGGDPRFEDVAAWAAGPLKATRLQVAA